MQSCTYQSLQTNGRISEGKKVMIDEEVLKKLIDEVKECRGMEERMKGKMEPAFAEGNDDNNLVKISSRISK